MLKIATWNVNSIRARILNFMEWVKESSPDVILLQELKCTNDQFPFLELDSLGYNIEICGQKGKNGVAIFSKFPLENIKKSLPVYNIVDKDDDARYIEAYFTYESKLIKVASIYVPNGGPSIIDVNNNVKDVTSTTNFINKMKFNDRVKIKFKESIDNDEVAIFGGDYNVCPNLYIDVYSPKKDGSITCTEQERQKFKEFLDIGMIDIWRELNLNFQEYSWWGYRPYTMWEKNQGFRIDALMVTPKTAKLIKECKIFREVRGKEKASDHVPMMCLIN